MIPRYPIFIPSKGRFENNLTAKMFLNADIPFRLIVEKKDEYEYRKRYGDESVISLPSSDYGGVWVARNYCKQIATQLGSRYHWQIDDDIKSLMKVENRIVLTRDAGQILSEIENFVDKYSNLAITGLASSVFGRLATTEFTINKFAYTCALFNTGLPYYWRCDIEDDLDYNLQCLTNGWCTVQFQRYLFEWSTTGVRPGGYTEIYAEGKRLLRQRATLEMWPEILPRELAPKGDNYRIITNHIWKGFKQNLRSIDQPEEIRPGQEELFDKKKK